MARVRRIEVERMISDRNCSTYYEHVNVVQSTTYDGVDIYRCSQKWYYIFDGQRWQYFGDLREAKRFIDNWYREK